MQELKSLIQKVDNQQELNNIELYKAIEFYKNVKDSMMILGDKYFIALQSVIITLENLEQLQSQRMKVNIVA